MDEVTTGRSRKKVTIADVAAAAKVSPATVSRVINNDSTVSTKTRRHVMEIIEKMGYLPSRSTRSAPKLRSRLLGCILADRLQEILHLWAYPLFTESHRYGYSVILDSVGPSMEQQISMVESIVKRGVDGILMMPAHQESLNSRLLKYLKTTNIPFVLIACLPGTPCDYALFDPRTAPTVQLEHLFERGHKHIAYVANVFYASLLSRNRVELLREGFYSYISKKGLAEQDVLFIEKHCTPGCGLSLVNEIFESLPAVTAIASPDGIATHEIVKGLRQKGVHVPEQVELIGGFEPGFINPFGQDPLWTAYADIPHLLNIAVRTLNEKIEAPQKLKRVQVELPHNLIRIS